MAIPLQRHQESEYIRTIVWPYFREWHIANLAVQTLACCADLLVSWSCRIWLSEGLQADFRCSLPSLTANEPLVNQAFIWMGD
jgi:hypothetical protein